MGWLDALKSKQLQRVANRSLASTFVKSVSSEEVFAVVGASSINKVVKYKLYNMETRQTFRVSEANFSKFYEFIYKL